MIDPSNLRPALAFLKASASHDTEAMRVLTEHNDLLELVDSLAYMTLLFIREVCDDPRDHIDLMFAAVTTAETGDRW